jgi:hypothetical protein
MKHGGSGARAYATGALAIFGAGSLMLRAWRLQTKFFGRNLPYRLNPEGRRAVDDEEFAEFVAAISDAPIHRDTRVSVQTNGENFYPAELEV